uniref:AFG1-like ATPase n=1 Tax=Jaculus jaculus TaxID=51337 RepID=A0A8C5KA27_JACJA
MAGSWSPLGPLRSLARSRLRGRCVGCGARAAALLPPASGRGKPLWKAYTVPASESIIPTPASEAHSKALAGCRGPLDHYDFLIKAHELKVDEHQRRVVQCLQKLHEDLKGYTIEEGLFSKLFSRTKPPKGLYVYGDVGTGKTMVMDIFYAYVEMKRKKRVHFHGFMLDVHKRIHRLKQSLPKRKAGFMAKPYDPIAPIAEEISQEACLLCFDEFQVTDIADAMILKQLFENLFKNGVVVVATSNRPPEGKNKHCILSLLVLQEYCETVQLDSGIDYRKRELTAAGKTYYLTSEADVEAVMDKLFDELAQKQNDLTRARILQVQGRELRLNKACGTVADCTFEELCERPLGASDYLELSKNFDTVFLRNIPQFSLAKRTQARRFITLIDNFYDFKVRIICSAAAPIASLFLHQHHDSELEQSRILMDDLGLSQDSAGLSMFTGEEEIFAFQRTISRLTEMQNEQYWIEGDRSQK